MKTLACCVAALVGLSALIACGSEVPPPGPAPLRPQPAGLPPPAGSPPATHLTPPPAELVPRPRLPASSASSRHFQPGEIIVKYASGGAKAVTQDVEQWLAEGRSFDTATADASSSLDAVHRFLEARAARSFLPGRRGLSTLAAKKLLAQRTAFATARSSRPGWPVPARTLADLANVYVLTLPADADIEAAVARAKRDPHVEYAQPNFVVKADFTPNDPYFATSGSWVSPSTTSSGSSSSTLPRPGT